MILHDTQTTRLPSFKENVTYLCQSAMHIVAFNSNIIHTQPARGPLACLQYSPKGIWKARPEPNLDDLDISEDQTRVSQKLSRGHSGKAGQRSGDRGNRKSTAHVNTCTIETYVPEVFQPLTRHNATTELKNITTIFRNTSTLVMQKPLFSNVIVMFSSSIVILTPNGQLLDCATLALSEGYVGHVNE